MRLLIQVHHLVEHAIYTSSGIKGDVIKLIRQIVEVQKPNFQRTNIGLTWLLNEKRKSCNLFMKNYSQIRAFISFINDIPSN